MNSTRLIDLVLRPHHVHVTVASPWGQETAIVLRIPDLREAPRSVWGDWGPMYTVSPPPGVAIQMSVQPPGDLEPTEQPLELESLEVQSPVLADVRAATPLVMQLPLRKERLHLQVFYDTLGRAVRAEITALPSVGGSQGLYRIECRDEIPASAADTRSAAGSSSAAASATEVQHAAG